MISVFANALHDKTNREAFETCKEAGWHPEEFDCDRDDNTIDCEWDDNVEVLRSSSIKMISTFSLIQGDLYHARRTVPWLQLWHLLHICLGRRDSRLRTVLHHDWNLLWPVCHAGFSFQLLDRD